MPRYKTDYLDNEKKLIDFLNGIDLTKIKNILHRYITG